MGTDLRKFGLTMKYSDNFWKLKRQLKQTENGNQRITTATVSNTAKHAVALDSKRGYFVVSNEMLYKYVHAELRRLKTQFGPGFASTWMVYRAIQSGILVYIAWLRSTVGQKPPKRGMSGPRPMHPGRWADITGQLNSSWRYRIDNGPWMTEPEWRSGKRKAAKAFKKIYGKP